MFCKNCNHTLPKLDFSQTASITVNTPIKSDFPDRLTDKLLRESEIKYASTSTDDGYFMKPVFGSTWRRNSFTPEITISVSRYDERTVLHLTGRPIKSVRIFVAFFISFALFLEAILIAIAIFSGLDSLIPLFIPIGMCIFCYFLCKLATKADFQTVVNTIPKVLQ